MKKISTLFIAGLFSMGTAAFAQDDVNFDELDQDSDGQLSRTEVAQNGDLAANFSRLDADGDGYLSQDEAQNASLESEGEEYRAVTDEGDEMGAQSEDFEEVSVETDTTDVDAKAETDVEAEAETEEDDWQ